MATWGAYFSSYVKKTSDPKQVELEELNEKELLSRGTGAPRRIESISSQKSNSSAKKLYDIVAEPTNQPFQRSNSNAARVAKMFGYGTPAPATEVQVEEKAVQPVAPLATWTKIESSVMQPIAPLAFAKKVESPVAPAVSPPSFKKAEGKTGPGHAPKRSKQDIFAMLDDFANMADNPDSIQILPDPPKEKPVVSEIKVEMKPIITEVAKENPVSLRKESFSFRGQISPILSRPKLVVSRNPSQSEPSEDFRARMLEFEMQSEQLKLEQKRREEEREQMLKYERMQEQMQYEREKMEIEREKMLEEERRFKEEADRIAEEEKQMEQFMKNFQVEMERDRENEERKRGAKEEAERERQRAIEEEERRIREEEEEEERRREAQMEAEERRQRNEKEAEERRLQAERDREEEDREMKEYEARRAARQREAEEKERRMRMKDERLAQEEADRLNAKIREAQEAERRRNEYEEELEADRRRYEEEEERRRIEEEEEAEMERQRQYEAEQEAERIRFEQEEAEMERQRARDERIATQRRVAQERAQRAQFEEDESRRKAQERADRRFSAERRRDQEEESDDNRPLTKEEEMKKAEEKIRQAFAGLAKERDQAAEPLQRSNTVAIQMPRPMQPVKNYARGITPAGRESRIYKGEPEVQRSERAVSRYNTVGARPQQPKSPGVLRKTPRQPPGGGMGLPGGPRAGLPAGPRRNRTVQR